MGGSGGGSCGDFVGTAGKSGAEIVHYGLEIAILSGWPTAKTGGQMTVRPTSNAPMLSLTAILFLQAIC